MFPHGNFKVTHADRQENPIIILHSYILLYLIESLKRDEILKKNIFTNEEQYDNIKMQKQREVEYH